MADYEYYDTLDSFSEINHHETDRINFCGYALSKGAKKSNINGKEVDAIDVMGEHFARLMASYSVSNSAEYRDQDELTEDALDAVEEKKEEIMKSTVYREMFQQKNKDAVLEMIFGAKQLDDMKNGVKKDLPEMLPPDRLAENFAGKLRQQKATEKTQKDILKELKTTQIQKFYNLLLDRGTLSVKTIKNIHGVLHKALTQAYLVGEIKQNPADRCQLPKTYRPKIEPLENEDITRFLEAIKGHKYEIVYFLTLFAGLRQGEVLGLTWDCVDFDKQVIHVVKQLKRERKFSGKNEYIFDTLKNGKTRIVSPAPAVLLLHQPYYNRCV